MLDRIKNGIAKLDDWVRIAIFIIFVIAVISTIFRVIFGRNKVDNINLDKLNEFVEIYTDDTNDIKENNFVVKDYSTYYKLKSSIDNFMSYVSKGKYSDLYDICNINLKEKLSEDEFVKLLKDIDDEFVENYVDNNYIDVAYVVDTDYYICNIKYNDFSMKVGIKLNTSDYTYTLFYLDIGD